MILTKCKIESDKCLHQGDILTNVEYIECAEYKEDIITISKILFPKVVVLTQECDVIQDYNGRNKYNKYIDTGVYDGKETGKEPPKNHQYLLSVLVAPLYKFEDIIEGKHLDKVGIFRDGTIINKSFIYDKMGRDQQKLLISNKIDRYHYLDLDINGKSIKYVVDFKHYFAVNTEMLIKHKQEKNYFASIDDLYKNSLNHRFSYFLSRVGLPDTNDCQD